MLDRVANLDCDSEALGGIEGSFGFIARSLVQIKTESVFVRRVVSVAVASQFVAEAVGVGGKGRGIVSNTVSELAR
jgi:hypothetical protein